MKVQVQEHRRTIVVTSLLLAAFLIITGILVIDASAQGWETYWWSVPWGNQVPEKVHLPVILKK